MKTMTRPTAGAGRPAAGFALPPTVRLRPAARLGRSSQVRFLIWTLAAGSAATVALLEPSLLPWLLLPVAPALLVRAAGGEAPLNCGPRVMRLFAAATLAAVFFQLVATPPDAIETVLLPAGTILFLGAVERLAVSSSDWRR